MPDRVDPRRDAVPDRQPGPDRGRDRARGRCRRSPDGELLRRPTGEGSRRPRVPRRRRVARARQLPGLRRDGRGRSVRRDYEPVPLVRPPFRGTAWARGVAEMAAAIAEGRPHRASAEQAAHVVDILEAAAHPWRTAARRRGRLDVHAAATHAVGRGCAGRLTNGHARCGMTRGGSLAARVLEACHDLFDHRPGSDDREARRRGPVALVQCRRDGRMGGAGCRRRGNTGIRRAKLTDRSGWPACATASRRRTRWPPCSTSMEAGSCGRWASSMRTDDQVHIPAHDA